MDFEFVGEPLAKVRRKARKKLGTTFLEEDTTKLIQLVRQNPCLWDAGLDEYSTKTIRSNTWADIKEHFNDRYTESDLRTKWSNLRIQYRINLSKLKRKSGHGPISAPVWRHFSTLKFLGKATELQRIETLPNLDQENASGSDINEPVTSKLYRAESTSKRPAQLIVDMMQDAVDAIAKSSQDNKDDQNMQMCNYIYSEMALLSEKDASILRKKILNIVISFEPTTTSDKINHI